MVKYGYREASGQVSPGEMRLRMRGRIKEAAEKTLTTAETKQNIESDIYAFGRFGYGKMAKNGGFTIAFGGFDYGKMAKTGVLP